MAEEKAKEEQKRRDYIGNICIAMNEMLTDDLARLWEYVKEKVYEE